jgi:hypothetical protein
MLNSEMGGWTVQIYTFGREGVFVDASDVRRVVLQLIDQRVRGWHPARPDNGDRRHRRRPTGGMDPHSRSAITPPPFGFRRSEHPQGTATRSSFGCAVDSLGLFSGISRACQYPHRGRAVRRPTSK